MSDNFSNRAIFVIQSWSMTERKIVRYDSSNGDQFEPPGGHGM